MDSKRTIEFDQIIEKLKEYAVSDKAKKEIEKISPYMDEVLLRSKTAETTEARTILDQMGNPPLAEMKDIDEIITLAVQGSMLWPEQLTNADRFLASVSRMRAFLTKAEYTRMDIVYFKDSMSDIPELRQEITLAIRDNAVDDHASKTLAEIRKKMERTRTEIKTKLETMLRTKKEYFTEGFVSMRNGHYVLPVKKEFKHQISGTVHGMSSTQSTYFIEPMAAIHLTEQLNVYEIEERQEVNKILYTLSSMVAEYETEIKQNISLMTQLDVIFAKAKMSSDMKAAPAILLNERKIKIVDGRHPLLKKEECVPLDFAIGDGINGIVVTGPNTGGKTVALKTVGLFSMMAQSGLHIPAKECEITMMDHVLCDIGDGQSILENLSTFSAHITNIISILDTVTEDSLVLLDELGSGTDPYEGMGIAIAILEELRKRNCLFVVTTHYPEVKEYAKEAKGLINARMAFDRENLCPLYRLEIGEAGESCALYIAKRLGFPEHMLSIAKQRAYHTEKTIEPAIGQTKMQPKEKIETDQQSDTTLSVKKSSLIRQSNHAKRKELPAKALSFVIGDSVLVYPQKKIGIVCQLSNEMGELGVQIAGKKQLVSYKRLQLKASAADMYPPDYDFSIIFDTVENRKAKHKMEKGYHPELIVHYDKEL